MIEKIVYDYLNEYMNVPVFMEMPAIPSEDYTEIPQEYILIEKVGGDITDHIRSATIAIQSYSTKSLYNAAALNEELHGVMDAMADRLGAVSQSKMTADTNFTDTSTKRYRYQCLYSISY